MDTKTDGAAVTLGDAAPSPERLAAAVRAALAHPGAIVTDWWLEPVQYVSATPSTGGLYRVCGTAAVGTAHADWSFFVKVLQSAARWPFLDQLPADVRELFLASFPWRLELEARQSGVAEQLPAGMRLPHLYAAVEIGDDRIALWMEDVRPCADPWDLDRFRRAAYALGRLAARRRMEDTDPFQPADPLTRVPGAALRTYVDGRVRQAVAQLGSDPSTWQHPVVAAALAAAGETDLPRDLAAAAERLDEILARLDALPQTYVHGDASPQNLLVPAEDPSTFVVIDWGFNTPQAVGFDLGQLLVGLCHAGELRVAELPTIHEAVVPAYLSGLDAEGMAVDRGGVVEGYVGSMVVRSAFTALPFELLDESPANEHEQAAREDPWLERVRLTRYLLDLGAELPR